MHPHSSIPCEGSSKSPLASRIPSCSIRLAVASAGLALITAAFAQTEEVTTLDEMIVRGESESDHIVQGRFLPAVQGTKINSGKKNSVIDLDELPEVTGNNYRQALIKTPGLYLSEETTPLLSIGNRGLDPGRVQRALEGLRRDGATWTTYVNAVADSVRSGFSVSGASWAPEQSGGMMRLAP